MTWLFFNESVWETFSLFAIGCYLLYRFVRYVSNKQYAMSKLMVAIIAIVLILIFSVKAQRLVEDYRMVGIVDIILAGAMGLILFDFILVFARACGICITAGTERLSVWIVAIAYVLGGLALFFTGSEAQFAYLDYVVDRCLQPFWVLVIIRFFIPNRSVNKDDKCD